MEENEKEELKKEKETNEVKRKKSKKMVIVLIEILVAVVIIGFIANHFIVEKRQEQEQIRKEEIKRQQSEELRLRKEENMKKIENISNNIYNTNTNTYNESQECTTNKVDSVPYPDSAKPIIYLYPQEEKELTVELGYPEKLSCSYPKYENEWNVIAEPDGTLIDKETGKRLYSLYWEGNETPEYNFDEGFCVKGEDTAKFLEEKLEILGLNYKEAEEFIIYWLPKMEDNEYNLIRFASKDEINEYMPLEFSKEPDSLIRVLMQFKGLDEYIEVKEQKLETPERTGFVAVEWGGSQLK